MSHNHRLPQLNPSPAPLPPSAQNPSTMPSTPSTAGRPPWNLLPLPTMVKPATMRGPSVATPWGDAAHNMTIGLGHYARAQMSWKNVEKLISVGIFGWRADRDFIAASRVDFERRFRLRRRDFSEDDDEDYDDNGNIYVNVQGTEVLNQDIGRGNDKVWMSRSGGLRLDAAAGDASRLIDRHGGSDHQQTRSGEESHASWKKYEDGEGRAVELAWTIFELDYMRSATSSPLWSIRASTDPSH